MREWQRLRDGERATELATITCRRGPCRIAAPSNVRLTVGSDAYRARVTGPRHAQSGRTVALRATLPPRALAQMKRTRRIAVVRARIQVTYADGGTATRLVRRALWATP